MNNHSATMLIGLLGLLNLAGCGGTPSSPAPSSGGGPVTPPTSVTRVVPIYMSAWGCLACPQPRITATLQGRALIDGYNIFNLAPGTYELVGTLLPSAAPTLDDRDRWDIAFTTFPQLGSLPEISDNGVEISSIVSEAGPNATFNRSECGVFYRLPQKTSQQFRIRFRVSENRSQGISCPVQHRG